MLFGLIDKIIDSPDIESLSTEVSNMLSDWSGEKCLIERLDSKYMPIEGNT